MKRPGPTLLLLLGLVADAAVADEPIYRLDYPNRAPEFTDRPPQQSTPPVTLGAPSAFPALRGPNIDQPPGPTATASPAPRPGTSGEIPPKPAIAILSPGPGEGMRANNGAVPLDLALSPALGPEERLRLSLDGIKNKIHPGEAMDKDLYDLPAEELAGLPTVCAGLDEALAALDADRAFLTEGGVFTDDQIDAYIDLKMEEVTALRMQTHPVEFQLYYSC